MKYLIMFFALTCTTAFAGDNQETLTTLANTDEGKIEVKTYAAEMCKTHADTKKPCGIYLEFYTRKAESDKPQLIRTLTYNEFLNLFDAKPQQEKKPGIWSKIVKGVGGALLSILKLFVPGVAPVVEIAKIAFDAAGKIVGDAAPAPMGQVASVGSQAIVD